MPVSFPASAALRPVAHVAASNIAYRLNYSMKTLKRLQGAVDAVTEALSANGSIKLVAQWTQGPLSLTLSNPKAKWAKDEVEERQDSRTARGATKTSIKATSVAFTISD